MYKYFLQCADYIPILLILLYPDPPILLRPRQAWSATAGAPLLVPPIYMYNNHKHRQPSREWALAYLSQ